MLRSIGVILSSAATGCRLEFCRRSRRTEYRPSRPCLLCGDVVDRVGVVRRSHDRFGVRVGHSATSAQCPVCPRKRTSATHHGMSRVPKAAVSRCSGELFDHFVGNGEHAWWNCEAERLGGLHVDDQLELGWQLHRKFGGLVALENAISIDCRLPK
jgi:hypothetical protein